MSIDLNFTERYMLTECIKTEIKMLSSFMLTNEHKEVVNDGAIAYKDKLNKLLERVKNEHLQQTS